MRVVPVDLDRDLQDGSGQVAGEAEDEVRLVQEPQLQTHRV